MSSLIVQTEETQPISSISVSEIEPEHNLRPANFENQNSSQNLFLKILLAVASFIIIVLVWILLDIYFEPFYAERKISGEVLEILEKNRFFDIHFYTNDEHSKRTYQVLQYSQKELTEKREFINITQTDEEIEALIKVMRRENLKIEGKYKNPFPPQNFNEEKVHDAYFFTSLSEEPENNDYLGAEYYWYEKRYNISQYGNELPLCAIMIGKNNKRTIKNMYESIESQNYTNYKVIHVDDNSNDGTLKVVNAIIKNSSVLSKRVTLIVQPRQMNSLYNRNFSYSFCGEDDIIVDMDSDDWLIGKQVFQLVNTVYQQGGNTYNKSEQTDTWAAYFDLIQLRGDVTTFTITGNVPLETLEKQSYRSGAPQSWRTTHLRTFLHKIYKKVDTKDFIDPLTERTFMIRQDVFIQTSILELSAPKHIKFIDEFLYFYKQYPGIKNYEYVYYAERFARTLPPYNPLNSLDDEVTRNYAYEPPESMLKEKQNSTEIVEEEFQTAKAEILTLIKEENQDNERALKGHWK